MAVWADAESRARELGVVELARHQEHGQEWIVFAAPEGNEVCVHDRSGAAQGMMHACAVHAWLWTGGCRPSDGRRVTHFEPSSGGCVLYRAACVPARSKTAPVHGVFRGTFRRTWQYDDFLVRKRSFEVSPVGADWRRAATEESRHRGDRTPRRSCSPACLTGCRHVVAGRFRGCSAIAVRHEQTFGSQTARTRTGSGQELLPAPPGAEEPCSGARNAADRTWARSCTGSSSGAGRACCLPRGVRRPGGTVRRPASGTSRSVERSSMASGRRTRPGAEREDSSALRCVSADPQRIRGSRLVGRDGKSRNGVRYRHGHRSARGRTRQTRSSSCRGHRCRTAGRGLCAGQRAKAGSGRPRDRDTGRSVPAWTCRSGGLQSTVDTSNAELATRRSGFRPWGAHVVAVHSWGRGPPDGRR